MKSDAIRALLLISKLAGEKIRCMEDDGSGINAYRGIQHQNIYLVLG